MDNSMLSQEEIDALLKGDDSSSSFEDNNELSDIEKDAVGEIANISMGTAATTLSTILGKKVDITTPKVSLTSQDKIHSDHPLPYVAIDVQYKEGVDGNSVLIIKQSDASIIVDLMMGGTGEVPPKELDELHISAIGEAMNQMMGSAATSLSTVLNDKIDISPPSVSLIDFSEEKLESKIETATDILVKISFRMVIDSLVDSEFMQLIPLNVAVGMVNKLMNEMHESSSSEPSYSNNSATATQAEPIGQQDSQRVSMGASKKGEREIVNSPEENVKVQPANFAPLEGNKTANEPRNIDLLLDIPLQVSVELGRTKKTIKEILELASGSVIELDKLAGEPVDLLVNGKLIAKGEVVVIDENFGLRVTDIVSPLERIHNLK